MTCKTAKRCLATVCILSFVLMGAAVLTGVHPAVVAFTGWVCGHVTGLWTAARSVEC